MKRGILLPIFFVFWGSVNAQQTGSTAVAPLVADGTSLVVHGRTEETFENSPYIPDDGWLPGFFVEATGKRLNMPEMRYNTHLERVEYQQDGKVYYPKAPVVSFGFTKGEVFLSQFPTFDKHDGNTFFQVLYGGPTRLVRHIKSTVSDVTPYNSATKIWHFNRHITYYVFNEQGMMGKSKKLDDSLLKAFAAKKDAVTTYMKTNNLKWSDAASLKQIMAYYDSL